MIKMIFVCYGTIIAVDCRAMETALDADTWQRSELDWLIYNKPLVFSGEIEEYIKDPAECCSEIFFRFAF